MSEMIMGQIGPIRLFTREELQAKRMQVLASAKGERETDSIAGMFAEALGCLEDAGHWLCKLKQEFEKLYPDDMDPKDPAAPFWYAVNEAITSEPFTDSPLRDILQELQAVRKYVPKETAPSKEQVP